MSGGFGSERGAESALVPWLMALSPSMALFALPNPPFGDSGDAYLRYKAILGGNPNEVFSHFLDLVLISGNVAAFSALLVWEASFRDKVPDSEQLASRLHEATVWGIAVSVLVALWLDNTRGEGASIILYPLGVLPVLLACKKVLRRLAASVEWQASRVAVIGAVFALLHAGFQYFYEPSQTGAPNALFLPLWLSSLGYLWWDARRRPAEDRSLG